MAWVQSSAAYTWYEDQALTRAVPTTSSTDGVPLKDLTAITIEVEANSGQTLSGAGNLRCYLYDAAVGRWARVPAADLAVSTASVRNLSFEAFEILGARKDARIQWITDSVTVSSGSDVRVYVLGYSKDTRGS